MTQAKKAIAMDDITKQARQGSVAAIIQLLNEKLAAYGVRTRAMFVNGVLQLLCEAAAVEQLEQSALVAQIKQILENLAPRNIRRVNINSRIVREQQLLWLEEINRDPESQLLWSQQIILNKPNILIRLWKDINSTKPNYRKPDNFPKTPLPNLRQKNVFGKGIMGGAALALVLVLVGWKLNDWLNTKQNAQKPISKTDSSAVQTSSTPASLPSSVVVNQASEPFVDAVRLAEQTSAAGKKAISASEWLDLAAKWQRASDLMGAVPATDRRYKTAQNRQQLYRQHSDAAQQEARRLRSP